jgi:hypothetical protein
MTLVRAGEAGEPLVSPKIEARRASEGELRNLPRLRV